MFRGDRDALKMATNNPPNLPFKLITEYHHSCKYNENTACLIDVGLILIKMYGKIPE